MLTFFIPGIPEAEPRARKGKHGNWYRPRKNGWREKVAWLAKCHAPGKPLQGPVTLKLWFVLPPPKKMAQECSFMAVAHAKRPDVDNLVKNVADSLTAAKFWKDDCQVYRLEAMKHYGEPAGVTVTIVEQP